MFLFLFLFLFLLLLLFFSTSFRFFFSTCSLLLPLRRLIIYVKRQRGTHKRFWQWFDRNMLPTEVLTEGKKERRKEGGEGWRDLLFPINLTSFQVREIKKAVHTAAETLKFVKPFVPTNIVYNLLMNNDSTSR